MSGERSAISQEEMNRRERRGHRAKRRVSRQACPESASWRISDQSSATPPIFYPLVVLVLCVRPLVDEFLAALVQEGAHLDQLPVFQGEGFGEEVGVGHLFQIFYPGPPSYPTDTPC